MSYKALYRKYRPQTFDEVVSQEHIVLTLKNIIKSQKISHAYLFCGPRGTGKTSVAHIFANEINQTTPSPDRDNKLDIIEVDAASNNGVAEIRRLIDNSNFFPLSSKYKVYIIDEVHMMTKGAFNALLKTLEEPPHYLIFIFATTEPHKIPTTILSRTQRFNFKRIDDKLIVKQLEMILAKESIDYEPEAIKFVARIAQGSMRDALSIVDQAAAYSDNKISFVAVSQVFGIVSIPNQIKILNLVYVKKTKEFLLAIEDFFNNGVDIDRLINSLIDIAKDYIVFNKTSELELCTILLPEDLETLAISLPFAYKVVTELVELLNVIRFSETKKQLFEITLLKLSESSHQSDDNVNVKEQANPTPNPTTDTISDSNNQEKFTTTNDHTKQAQKEVETITKKMPIASAPNDVDADAITPDEVHEGDQTEKHIATPVEQVTDGLQQPQSTPDGSATKPLGTVASPSDSQLDEHEPTYAPQEDQHEAANAPDVSNIQAELETVASTTPKPPSDIPNPETSPETHMPPSWSENELINYLRHADKTRIQKFKMALPNVINWIDKINRKDYVTLIEKASLISGGPKFIIISSRDENVVQSLKEVAHQQDFINLMNEVLNEPVHIVVISKAEFKTIRSKWEILAQEDRFPPLQPLPDVAVTSPPKTNAEKFGEDLFGDLFK